MPSESTKECDTKKRVQSLVIDLFEDQINLWELSELDEKTNVVDHLGFDSIDLIELMMHIEEEFHITIDERKFVECRTVEQIISLVYDTKNKTQ